MATTLIINLWPSSHTLGHSLGIKSLIENELGESATVVDGVEFKNMSSLNTADKLVSVLRISDPDYVMLIGSTSSMNLDPPDFNRVNIELAGRSVLYWEPDGWGRGKPISETMKMWFYRSDILLHAGGVKDLWRYTSPATFVGLAPQTYCHIQSARAEAEPPERKTQFEATMVANNVTRSRIPIPGFTGLSGSYSRWDLARRAHRQLGGDSFQLHGSGWPKPWSGGGIEFGSQVAVIRNSRMSLVWDHYLNLPDYVSDRLIYSLLAGRIHLMGRGSRLKWLPFTELSVRSGSSPKEMVDIMQDLLAKSPEETYELGIRNWEWVRHRMGSLQFAQFALSKIRSGIEVPNFRPWNNIKVEVRGIPHD